MVMTGNKKAPGRGLLSVLVCAIAIFVISGLDCGGAKASTLVHEYLPSIPMTEPYVAGINKAVIVINDAPNIESLSFGSFLISDTAIDLSVPCLMTIPGATTLAPSAFPIVKAVIFLGSALAGANVTYEWTFLAGNLPALIIPI
jgi:hypothetical protein